MVIFSAAAFCIYLLWLLYEKWSCDRARISFSHVIHVNGIRGKTSVCRLLDAYLRQNGYRVFTKTTGSTPVYIDTAGVEHRIPRRGPANIREQISVMRRAYHEKAEILIVECMAVSPELQEISQKRIVRGDWNIITNVRYDHIFEMGETLEEIAESLSTVIPRGGLLFTADQNFYRFFQKKAWEAGTEVILCDEDISAEPEESLLYREKENLAVVAAIAAKLGCRKAKQDTMAYLREYREDFGSCKWYPLEGRQFLNLFSANDPQSTMMLMKRFTPDCSDITLLYNHRLDRPDRLLLFMRYFFPEVSWKKLIVMGDGSALATRCLVRAGFQNVICVRRWREAVSASKSSVIIGIGNIRGEAYDMISFLEGGRRV